MDPVFHPSARAELDASVDFYESRSKGLAGGSSQPWRKRLGASPNHPTQGRLYSVASANGWWPGFPFTVVYRVSQRQLFIVAVAHQHRRPDYWRRRRDLG
jgi:hypothetical protein